MKALICLFGLLLSSTVFAYSCYLTVAKDNCWTNYDVTVLVLDGDTQKQITSLEIPKATSWNRTKFECHASQKLMYKAKFSPNIWAGSEKKEYQAQSYSVLPDSMAANKVAWSLNVCYPKAFSGVPIPLGAISNCSCDFDSIPAIPEGN